ncbi:MAG TPA: ATP-binding protein [Acetobacteraceae bacterium]|nr:ATP-binding protein [Acetobacteraceae bacterium]
MTIVAAAALLLAGIGLAVIMDRRYEVRRIDDLTAQARILAATETAALAFNDGKAAQEYLDALRANPQIVAAGLYLPDGKRFASYPREPPTSLPPVLGSAPAGVPGGDLITVSETVRQGDEVLGDLVMQIAAEPFAARVQREGAIGLLVAMATLLVGVLGVAQSALRRANAGLAAHAEELARANQALQDQIARREQAEAALRQAQKMEAIGQLTGGIAHDFNNLLQVVVGSLERIRARVGRQPDGIALDLERLVDLAMQAAQRGARLVRQMLAFSRRQPLAPKPLDLNALVMRISELLGRALGERIQIKTILAGRLWRVMVDENQLESALLNLAVNARDAIEGAGQLTIETANVMLDDSDTSLEPEVMPGEYVMLIVTDTGCGMPPAVLEKAFEPFFTTKEVGRGTGLGLSQVYGFIKQSGGHVKIASVEGQGTAVRLYLPRHDGPAEGAELWPLDDSIPRGNSGDLILVVEDEAGVRALSVATLRDMGYEVLEAEDARSALDQLDRHPGVRLLFTDIGLPGEMNGRDLAEAARRVLPGLKVLLTSAYAQDSHVYQDRIGSRVDLLSKPFTGPGLARQIRAILDRTLQSDPADSR